MKEIIFSGKEDNHLDNPAIYNYDELSLACFGGATARGARKNEDGAYIITSDDFKFVALLDAHSTSVSAELMLSELNKMKKEIVIYGRDRSAKSAFRGIKGLIESRFMSIDFKSKSRHVKGEAACMIVFQKDKFMYWFTVGGNTLYLLNKDFIELNQLRVNQRHFYQWIGNQNSLSLEVPSFSSGVIELRKGKNTIFLHTGGLIEFTSDIKSNVTKLEKQLIDNYYDNFKDSYQKIINNVFNHNGIDSATFIAWDVSVSNDGLKPSR